jgi:hypothetical protein
VVWVSGRRSVTKENPDSPKDLLRSLRESQRRAATTARRYCASNGLNRLWTLTYAEEPTDVDAVWADVEDLRRRIARWLNKPIPLLAVIQRGGRGSRLHVHVAAGQYIPKETLHWLWRRRGWVDVRKVRAGGRRASCRQAAAYIAGYVVAGAASAWESGRKRYSTTRGFQPVSRQAAFLTQGSAQRWTDSVNEGELVEQWYSPADFEGPPIWVGFWDEAPP